MSSKKCIFFCVFLQKNIIYFESKLKEGFEVLYPKEKKYDNKHTHGNTPGGFVVPMDFVNDFLLDYRVRVEMLLQAGVNAVLNNPINSAVFLR